ncbi:MAG TPA: hypothetical protein VHV77_11775, partial [Pirellulales bacterium]|nr:hypothetical protein [Pirellulales bacterium]
MPFIARIALPRALVCLLFVFATTQALAIDHIVIKQGDAQRAVAGQVLETTVDGALMLESPDGSMWFVEAANLVSRTSDETPFASYTQAELAKRLLEELPPGFETFSTQNFLICHNTSKAYAQWCGALFEQLHRAFTNYWTRKGFDLQKPEFPMVAIVFADKQSYAAFARPELGDASEAIIGYYSLQTNRMTMYDLTGVESLR